MHWCHAADTAIRRIPDAGWRPRRPGRPSCTPRRRQEAHRAAAEQWEQTSAQQQAEIARLTAAMEGARGESSRLTGELERVLQETERFRTEIRDARVQVAEAREKAAKSAAELTGARERLEDERRHTETRLADQRQSYEDRLAELRAGVSRGTSEAPR